MKKLVALLLCAVLVLAFAACGNKETNTITTTTTVTTTTEAITEITTEVPVNTTSAVTTETEPDSPEDKDGITPLLYKVTDGKNNTVWLFGSIHVGRKYFYPLPDYVTDAYEGADALAVEFDTIAFESDTDAMMTALQALVYTDGTTIKDHVSEESYNRGVEILTELGMYTSFLDYYIPSMWTDAIELDLATQSGLNTEYGIDMHFLNKAYDDNKEIINVESAEFQYTMMANFSEELQSYLFDNAIENYDNPETYKADLINLLNLWEKGDEKNFDEYINAKPEFESEKEAALYKEYNDALTVNRNITMTDFAEDALKSGKEMFIVVGAAHVVGEDGMSGQLADRGYTVEIVR